MKVFTKIGSKERLFEIMETVNKVNLNEELGQFLDPKQTLEMAFEELKVGKLKVSEANTQVEGNETFVELVCIDSANNSIMFRFSGVANESDNDGVFTFGDAALKQFSFDAADGAGSVEVTEENLGEFNVQHKQEILDIVSNHADVEAEAPAYSTNDLEEAIRLIDAIKKDSMPFGGEFEKMQTPKNYVDKKPVNDKLRVSAEELDKFIREADDFLKMYPDDMETIDKQIMINKGIEGDSEFFESLPPPIQQDYVTRGVFEIANEMGMHPQLLTQKYQYEELKEKIWEKIQPIIHDLRLQKFNENSLEAQSMQASDAMKDDEIEDRGELDSLEAQSMQASDAMKEGDYPEKMGKEFSPQTSYPKKRKKHPKKIKIKTGAKKPITIGEYEYPANAATYQKLLDTAEEGGHITAHEATAQYISFAAKEIATEFDALRPDEQMRRWDEFYMNFLEKIKPKNQYYTKNVSEQGDDDELEIVGTPEIPDDAAAEKAASSEMNKEIQALNKGQQIEKWKHLIKHNNGIGVTEEKAENEKDVEIGAGGTDIEPEVHVSDDNMIPDTVDADTEEVPTPSIDPNASDTEAMVASKEVNPDDEAMMGGLGDGSDVAQFDSEQILKGIEVEMEHTDDPRVALEIAIDHLTEDPAYYGTGEEDPDKVAQCNAVKDAGESHPLDGVMDDKVDVEDKEEEDILLGFKPSNVGDYVGEVEVAGSDAIPQGAAPKGEEGDECLWCHKQVRKNDWEDHGDGWARCPHCGGN